MKLRTLLKEVSISKMPTPPVGINVEDYIDDLIKEIVRQYKVHTLAGYAAETEHHSGALVWTYKTNNDLVVMATPFWELEPFIPIEVIYDGDIIKWDRPIPFKPTYNKFKDIKVYLDWMSNILPAIGRKYIGKPNYPYPI